jgi:retron-type reverse transcriptase
MSLKNRKFRFKPSRIVLIPKANGKMRSLGVPSPRDKVIQQGYKMILESIFEPKFLSYSHGFRPNRSTITAIYEVRK